MRPKFTMTDFWFIVIFLLLLMSIVWENIK